MGIGSKLLDTNYKPEENISSGFDLYTSYKKIIKCPVQFTEDPFEYIEGYLGYKLRPFQRDVIEDIFSVDENNFPKYDISILILGMRCVHPDTNILMFDGTLKKAKDIKINDLVMGLDSTPRKVLSTHKGKSEMYEVKQSYADSYIVNENHILSLKKAKSVQAGKDKHERYKKEPNIVNISIKEYLNKSDKWKYFFRGYKAGFISFKEQEIPIDPYLLGVWLGDGTSSCLNVTSIDFEIVDWLRDYVKNNNFTLLMYDNNGKKAPLYKIREKHGKKAKIWDEFLKLDLKNNKHIPQIYISNSKDIRLKILAGLLDTDGWYNSRHGYEITLANEVLANDTKRLADSLGFITHIRKKKTTCNYNNFVGEAWRLSIYGKGTEEIPCKIERKKYEINGKHNHNEDYLSSLEIVSLGLGDFVGFEIDGDNLFCLADGTVTHNSGKSLISSTIGSFQLHKLLAMEDPAKQLGQIPHYKLSGCFVANSEQQSKQTAYASFENIINNTDWWNKYIGYLKQREENEGRETLFQQSQKRIYFKEKNLEVLSLHSNSSSLAGVTSFFYSFEEISRADISDDTVQSQTEKRTAQAIYYTGSRSAKSLYPYSKVIVTTSPMYENDFGMQLLYQAKDFKGGKNKYVLDALRSKYFPEKVNRMIAYNYTTTEANPQTLENPTGFTEDSFASEKMSNLTAYMRDFEALPPSALSPFFEHTDRIEKCVNANKPIVATFTTGIFEENVNTLRGVESRMYVGKEIYIPTTDKMRKYFVCCDQGEKRDAFVICMGHAEDVMVESRDGSGKTITIPKHKIIIDLIESWDPDPQNKITVSFQNVEEILKVLAQHFYIDTIAYDQWQSTESIQRLFSEGIHTEKLGANLEMYNILKMLIYSDMVELPIDTGVIQELRTLNLIKNKTIDHPVSGKKDKADALCRVVYKVYIDSIKDSITGTDMLPKNAFYPSIRGLQGPEYNLLSHGGSLVGSGNIFGNNVFGNRGTFVSSNVLPNLDRLK
jgi:hypothetical protein